MALAYDHRANSYLVKPVDFDRFVQLMNDLGLYWLAGIGIPGHDRPRCKLTVS